MAYCILGELSLEEQEDAREMGWHLDQLFPESNPEIVRITITEFDLGETLNILDAVLETEFEDESPESDEFDILPALKGGDSLYGD